MGLFKNVDTAPKYAEGGNWFKDGKFIVQVDAAKQGATRDSRDFAVIEHTILRSTNPELKPGANASLMHMKNDSFLSNVAHFVSQAKGIALEDVDDDGCELIFSEENPTRGIILRAKAQTIKTKAGNDYTKVTYYPINESDLQLLEKEGIVLPNKKSVKIVIRDDNPFNADDEGPAWVP